MIGYILAAVALIGGCLASWYDLRTTEVPDIVPLAMGLTGVILHLAHSLITGNLEFLVYSLGVGTIFLIIGLVFYWIGLWGGADALLLGAIGYILPRLPVNFSVPLSPLWPYQLTLILNIFLIGSLYSIIYSLFLAVRDQSSRGTILNQFKERKKELGLSIALVSVFMIGLSSYMIFMVRLNSSLVIKRGLLFFSLFLALVVLYHFLKGLEERIMKRKISVKQLKSGDVLAQDVELEDDNISSRQIRGLKLEEIEAIKQEKSKVTIKSGVCFIPTFPLAVLVTLTMGDIIYLFALSL